MKRSAFILLILILPFFSAATIEMNPSYAQGETIIAKVSGNFYDTIQESNIYFYRNHVKIPMDYDVAKIGDSYYVRASLIGKTENNYSMKINGVRYYDAGILKNTEIVKTFTVNNQFAPFSVNQGFIISQNNFSINVQNLGDSTLSISITKPSGINSLNSVQISSGQTKAILFDVSELDGTIEDTIKLSASSLSYTLPILITHIIPSTPEPVQEYCGDGIINQGETCEGSNLGSFSSCSNFGFNSGTLSCNQPGSSNECEIDNSNCYNSTSVVCDEDSDCTDGKACVNNNCVLLPSNQTVCGNGVREGYEQCDKNDWGVVKNCSFFNYDSGKLSCVSCYFSLSACYNDNSSSDGCTSDSQCSSGEECDNGECKEISSKECSFSWQCDDNEKCKSGYCLEEDECRLNKDCSDDKLCSDGECVECEDDFDCPYRYSCLHSICTEKDCLYNRDCAEGKDCISGVCRVPLGDSCDRDSQCASDEICSFNSCIKKSNQSSTDSNQEKLCRELSGEFCEGECQGDFKNLNGKICCQGSCDVKTSSSSGKYFGWGLLIVIVGFLIWFFVTKMRKTRSTQLPF